MAESQKISTFPNMGTLKGTEKLTGLQDGANKNVTIDNLKVYVLQDVEIPPHNELEGLNEADYQHLTGTELAKTQALHSLPENNVFMGNAENEPEAEPTLNIYDVDTTTTDYLNTEANWLDINGNPKNAVSAPGGIRGQRWLNNDYLFECVVDGEWIRYVRAAGYVNIWDIAATEKIKLENAANWTGVAYTGTAITGVLQGQMHYSATHLFLFVDLNTPIRIARV